MRKITIISMALVFSGFQSCNKEGKASINGQVAHHESIIPDARVYIKFGTNVFPGSDVSLYDTSINADANANYSYFGLTKGFHYAYGVGWDPGISDSVFGGVPFEIKHRKSELTVNIPITE